MRGGEESGIGVKHTVKDARAASARANTKKNVETVTQTIPPWVPRTAGVAIAAISAASLGSTFASWISSAAVPLVASPVWYLSFGIVFITVYVVVLILLSFTLHYIRVNVNERIADAQCSNPPKIESGEGVLGILRLFYIKNSHRRLEFIWDLFTKKYPGEKNIRGHITKLNLNDCILFTIDPDVLRYVLRDAHHKYIKSDPSKVPRDSHIYGFEKLIGNGIFNADHGPHALDEGRCWRIQRKIASSIFTKSQFQTYMREVLLRKARDACEILDKADGPVDMQGLFLAYTMDSICEMAFGENENSLFAKDFKPEDELGGIGTEFDIATKAMSNAVGGGFLPMLLAKQLQPVFLQKLAFSAFEALHPKGIAFVSSIKRLNKACHSLVRRRRSDENLSRSKDLLALFINAEKTHGEKLDNQALCDVVKSFVVAGRDTTAALLSFVFLELARNPECEKLLKKEIDELLGPDNGDDGKLTYEFVLKSMPYLRGVIYETLRLHPPVPIDFKVAAVDDVLPNGIPILAGWRINFFPWGMGRDERLWPNPLQFKPERWIPFSQPDPYMFPVFQAGPRICAGMNLALFEASLLTAVLTRRFSFSPAEGEDFANKTYQFTLTLRVEDGVPMRVRRRAKSSYVST
eukprot:m.108537 g.108537  ORF g.108537 m.108537 type:complete len:635 (-) comp13969_c0_seq2:28-1932(-)